MELLLAGAQVLQEFHQGRRLVGIPQKMVMEWAAHQKPDQVHCQLRQLESVLIRRSASAELQLMHPVLQRRRRLGYLLIRRVAWVECLLVHQLRYLMGFPLTAELAVVGSLTMQEDQRSQLVWFLAGHQERVALIGFLVTRVIVENQAIRGTVEFQATQVLAQGHSNQVLVPG